MKRGHLLAAIVLAALVVALGSVASAQESMKRVGLVIGFPDNTRHLEIVTVPQAATAFDVLEAASVEVASQVTAYGPAICGIKGVGCPAEDCFCDAEHFWAYYHLNAAGDAWTVAPEGAGSYVPADGAVEGFAWSGFDENYNPTEQPPVYTFEQIEEETSPEPVQVPEPGTILLLGAGLAGLAAYARRARAQ